MDYVNRYDEARQNMSEWLKDGKLQRKEYIIKGGLSKAPAGLQGIFDGQNTGKVLVSPQHFRIWLKSKLEVSRDTQSSL